MAQYIDKDALVAKINELLNLEEEVSYLDKNSFNSGRWKGLTITKAIIDTLEAKEVDLVIYTIIAECCDWLAMTTNLSHDEIEGCRNLMLTVKEEQLKAQKGEKA